MHAYIRSAGAVSPQFSLDKEQFFSVKREPQENFIKNIEPDYDRFVDSKMIRRMSRIVKTGVAAAMTCLREAAVESPAAIITATAYGCLEDSSSFLRKLIEFEEKTLSPTAFIQSTHNTVGAQIALLLKCHQYNNTIVHRDFSFENALVEAILLLEEGLTPVLVGAVDEITSDRQQILERFGLYRRKNQQIGNFAGEGAAFFLLDKKPHSSSMARIIGLEMIYKAASSSEILQRFKSFLRENELTLDELDLILDSDTVNKKTEDPDFELAGNLFQNQPIFPYQSLCGDYPTSSGFGLWLATLLLKEQKTPDWMKGIKFPLRNILIHHHSDDSRHSFLLIQAI